MGSPSTSLVQFPFGQVAKASNVSSVGTVDAENAPTIRVPFLTSVSSSGAGATVVLCVFTSTSVLPTPPIWVPVHETVRPLMVHTGAPKPCLKCAPSGAFSRFTVVKNCGLKPSETLFSCGLDALSLQATARARTARGMRRLVFIAGSLRVGVWHRWPPLALLAESLGEFFPVYRPGVQNHRYPQVRPCIRSADLGSLPGLRRRMRLHTRREALCAGYGTVSKKPSP